MEVGLTGRHVGDRLNTDANTVTLNAYTVADVYAFVDIPKSVFGAVDQTPADVPDAKPDRQALRDLG